MVYKIIFKGLENRWTEHAVKPTKFQKIWIGKDPKLEEQLVIPFLHN